MILDYYRIFYYVAQYKSFSKAAEVMGNNQAQYYPLYEHSGK